VLTAAFLLLALTGCAAFLLVYMDQSLAVALRIQMREIAVDIVLALACISGVILLLGVARDRRDRALIADWLDEHACLHTCCVEGHHPPPASPPPPPPIPPPPNRERQSKRLRNKTKTQKGQEKAEKRKKLAVLRKGCIAPRENRSQGVPGPVPRPDCQTNTLKRKRRTNKKLKLQEKLRISECKWRTSTHGGKRAKNSDIICCERKDCYRKFRTAAGNSDELAGVVLQYRKYYHSLDKDQKRMWWDEHTIYDGYARYERDGVLRRGVPYHSTRCENFQTMRNRLASCRPDEAMRPIGEDAWVGVCTNFLVFLTAGHHDTKDQHYIRKHVFNQAPHSKGAEPESLDVSLPSVRSGKRSGINDNEKKIDVTIWLTDEGKLALTNPDDNYSVLPYRSCADTHAHYIFEREKQMGKPWATLVFARALEEREKAERARRDEHIEDDEDDNIEAAELEMLRELEDAHAHVHGAAADGDATDEDEEERVHAKQKKARKKYRYGNRACGLKDPERPEDPKLAFMSYFNKTWRQDKHLLTIICREHLPFAKCDFCIQHRARAERKRTQDHVDQDNAALRMHLEDIKAEKLMYYSNRAMARRSPKKYMSIIIDGADQSKHDMPHFKDQSHMSSEAHRIKMHLYGALVHGRGAYAFTMPDHEPQGHNTTIQVLHHILTDQAKKGPLPEILKIQLDNTTKQNKGQYVFGYLDLLVEYAVFKDVEVSFLPVGHTHEDIDQFFSRISVWLRFYALLFFLLYCFF
jgi:hypothetical protein